MAGHARVFRNATEVRLGDLKKLELNQVRGEVPKKRLCLDSDRISSISVIAWISRLS